MNKNVIKSLQFIKFFNLMIQPQSAVAFKFTNTVKIQLPQFSVFNLKCLSVHIIH